MDDLMQPTTATQNSLPLRPTVLVVDDDKDQLEIFKMLLERSNYSVLGACSGSEALETIKTKKVNVVVCDVMMPKMNGLEFIQNLRTLPQSGKTPVILVTAGQQIIDFSSVHFKADSFFMKSEAKNRLIPRIRSLIGQDTSTEPVSTAQ